MALKGKIDKEVLEGKEAEKFVVEFTNGTFAQLKDLAKFLEEEGFKTDPTIPEEKFLEVIRISIGWIEHLKEQKSKDKKTDSSG